MKWVLLFWLILVAAASWHLIIDRWLYRPLKREWARKALIDLAEDADRRGYERGLEEAAVLAEEIGSGRREGNIAAAIRSLKGVRK